MAVSVLLKDYKGNLVVQCEMNQVPRQDESIKTHRGWYIVSDVEWDMTNNTVTLEVRPRG